MKLFPVYMTDREKRAVESAAARRRESLSGYIVKAALERAERESKTA